MVIVFTGVMVWWVCVGEFKVVFEEILIEKFRKRIN